MLLFGILFGAYILYRTRNKEAATINHQASIDTKEIPEIPIGSLGNNDPSIHEILGSIRGSNVNRRSIITVDGNYTMDKATVYKVINHSNPNAQWFMVYKKSDHDNFNVVDQAIRIGAPIWTTAVHNVTLRGCEWIVHKLKRCSGTLEGYIYSNIQDQSNIFRAIATFIENIVATTTRCTIVDIGYFANNQLNYDLMLLRVETLHNTTPYNKKNLFEWFITEIGKMNFKVRYKASKELLLERLQKVADTL